MCIRDSDLFWNDAAKRYGLGIDNFADIIKGTTLPYILEKYFSGYTEEFRQMVTKESTEYEKTMPLPPMPGSIEFIRMLKEHGVQIGLVTSSDNAKVKRAFGLLHLDNLFDTLVTADRITQGKPDPMCYLLAVSYTHLDVYKRQRLQRITFHEARISLSPYRIRLGEGYRNRNSRLP